MMAEVVKGKATFGVANKQWIMIVACLDCEEYMAQYYGVFNDFIEHVRSCGWKRTGGAWRCPQHVIGAIPIKKRPIYYPYWEKENEPG